MKLRLIIDIDTPHWFHCLPLLDKALDYAKHDFCNSTSPVYIPTLIKDGKGSCNIGNEMYHLEIIDDAKEVK